VAGVVLGAFVFGMTSQIFLLPHLDGIGEYSLLFAAVTAVAAWIATASPRVSYAGVQTALAFYFTQLRVFGPQVSLTAARNDALGILLGLFAMWIIFDRLCVRDTVGDLVKMFSDNMRRVARFDPVMSSGDLRSSVDRVRRERNLINASFDQIHNLGDSLVFEFGEGWQRKIQMREHLRRWQPQLRTYFLLQVALMQYRLFSPNRGFEREAEENAREGEQILSLLADLEDPDKRDRIPELRQTLASHLKMREDVTSQPHAENTGVSQPLSLSRQCAT